MVRISTHCWYADKDSRSKISQVAQQNPWHTIQHILFQYLLQLMFSGSTLRLRLLVSRLMGKSPPSIISPGKSKRLVEIFSNHSGELQLSPTRQHRASSLKGTAMLQESRTLTMEGWAQTHFCHHFMMDFCYMQTHLEAGSWCSGCPPPSLLSSWAKPNDLV